MSERALLPAFVREALEPDAWLEGDGALDAGAPRDEASGALLIDAERQLLALEEALWAAPAPSRSAAHPAGTSPDVPAPSFARLEAALCDFPTRYAPFFTQAAELFDLSEDAVRAELARLRAPKVWSFAGLPGISQVLVRGGPRVAAAETLFVRFAPGLRFPAHRHTGLERVLVLEGSYEDDGGVVHRAGELREWSPSTSHAFRVSHSEPCIIASVVFGRRFDAWPLRVLSALLGR
jgi:hypothetical protein